MLSLILTLLSGVAVVRAQPTGPIVTSIQIVGNQRVETDAIRVHITQLIGQPENPTVVDNDLKAIYKMGFFDTLTRVGFSNGVLTYYVHERPLITDIHFNGMKEVKASDSEVINALAIHAGAIYDPSRAQTTTRNITEIYQQKGYLDAKVEFKLIPHAQQYGDRVNRRQGRPRRQNLVNQVRRQQVLFGPASCATRWRRASIVS